MGGFLAWCSGIRQLCWAEILALASYWRNIVITLVEVWSAMA